MEHWQKDQSEFQHAGVFFLRLKNSLLNLLLVSSQTVWSCQPWEHKWHTLSLQTRERKSCWGRWLSMWVFLIRPNYRKKIKRLNREREREEECKQEQMSRIKGERREKTELNDRESGGDPWGGTTMAWMQERVPGPAGLMMRNLRNPAKSCSLWWSSKQTHTYTVTYY